MAWVEYPRVDADRPSRPPSGGIDLAVSATAHKDQAFDGGACLRNRANQLRNAVEGGCPPTLASLYKDPKLIKGGYLFAAEIFAACSAAASGPPRPTRRCRSPCRTPLPAGLGAG